MFGSPAGHKISPWHKLIKWQSSEWLVIYDCSLHRCTKKAIPLTPRCSSVFLPQKTQSNGQPVAVAKEEVKVTETVTKQTPQIKTVEVQFMGTWNSWAGKLHIFQLSFRFCCWWNPAANPHCHPMAWWQQSNMMFIRATCLFNTQLFL